MNKLAYMLRYQIANGLPSKAIAIATQQCMIKWNTDGEVSTINYDMSDNTNNLDNTNNKFMYAWFDEVCKISPEQWRKSVYGKRND